ncbi:BRO family protein [Oleidesulfovibrio alaskensis]|jgi:prophage antirepressor-like protein|nr:BRO family protein [Oleidesulfovibrio alaskensis]
MFYIGRQGSTNIINKSGLYSLILRSRKPEAIPSVQF